MLNQNQARIMEIDAEVKSLTREGERLVAMLHSLKTQYDRGLISKAHFERTVEESKAKLSHIDARVPQLMKEREQLQGQAAPAAPVRAVPPPAAPPSGGPRLDQVFQAVEEAKAMFKPVEERLTNLEGSIGMVKNVDDMRRQLEGAMQRALNEMWREVEKVKSSGAAPGSADPRTMSDIQIRLTQWKGAEERLTASLKTLEERLAAIEAHKPNGSGGDHKALLESLMPHMEKAVSDAIAARMGPSLQETIHRILDESRTALRKEEGATAAPKPGDPVALEKLRLATEARLRLLEKRMDTMEKR